MLWPIGRFAAAPALLGVLLTAWPAASDPPVVPPPAPVPRAFGDWQLVCDAACRVVSTLRSTQPGAAVLLRVTVTQDASGGWMLAVHTPLPLYLPDGLTLTPDQSDPGSFPWFTCTATGCTTRTLIEPDLLTALRRQRSASVALTLVDGSHVRLPLSLAGFSAALAALKLSPAP